MKNNRKCVCCSVEYKYCNRCNKDINLPSWKAIFHDENCKKIFDIARNYYDNKLTKEEAKKQFDFCDLSNKENFKPSIIKVIDEVYINNERNEIIEEKEELEIEVSNVLNIIENVETSKNDEKEIITYNNSSSKKKSVTKIKSKASVIKEDEENKDM